MTTIQSEILALPNGAQFFRADLHIHSFQGSHDVRDASMTPASIVSTAIQEGLDIIAIADHNEISNVPEAIHLASTQSLLIIPAVELSTSQGHLLCYLPTTDLLSRFYNHLTIVDRNSPNSRCQQSIVECLNLLEPLGGFGILAHVDAPNGFEQSFPGASPHTLSAIDV